MFNDKKYRAVSLRQLSVLFFPLWSVLIRLASGHSLAMTGHLRAPANEITSPRCYIDSSLVSNVRLLFSS